MTTDEVSRAAGPTRMPAGPEIDVRKNGETRRKAHDWAALRISESPPRGHSCTEAGTAPVDETSRTAGPAHIPAGSEIEDGKDGETRRNRYHFGTKRLWVSPPYGCSCLKPGTASVDEASGPAGPACMPAGLEIDVGRVGRSSAGPVDIIGD